MDSNSSVVMNNDKKTNQMTTAYKLLDDLDIEYGIFKTKEDAMEHRLTRRTFCIWDGEFIKYRIIEINCPIENVTGGRCGVDRIVYL